MIRKSSTKLPATAVHLPGAVGVQMQLLCGPDDGCPNFAMRRFILEAGGCTPRHQHPYEHEVFILAGAGMVFADGREQPIGPGEALYVAANEPHQFRNPGPDKLEFLCLVPALVHRPGAPTATPVDCATPEEPAR